MSSVGRRNKRLTECNKERDEVETGDVGCEEGKIEGQNQSDYKIKSTLTHIYLNLT